MEMMIIKLAPDDLEGLDLEQAGICFGCGRMSTGVEPDARGYMCRNRECERPLVSGLAQAAQDGRLAFSS